MKTSFGRLVRVGLLALLAVMAFDLFLHAGLLAPLYFNPSPFLLSPQESFRRIPIGYLSFVLLVVLLVWLMSRLGITAWKRGLVFGLVFGTLVWGAETLGLFSITTARPALLLGWFIGQSLELGIAGTVIGSGLAADGLRPLTVKVMGLSLLMAVLTIALQNIVGLTPP